MIIDHKKMIIDHKAAKKETVPGPGSIFCDIWEAFWKTFYELSEKKKKTNFGNNWKRRCEINLKNVLYSKKLASREAFLSFDNLFVP